MSLNIITSPSEVAAILPKLMAQNSWGLDTETTGLDPHQDKVVLVTIARPDVQYAIDTRQVPLEPLRPFFESEQHKKIVHHGKFDYKMIKGGFNIDVEGLRCTYLAEKIINNGRLGVRYSLQDVLDRRLGVRIDKSLQLSFKEHVGPYSADQIAYAVADSMYLVPLAQSLSNEIIRDGLAPTWLLECQVLPCFADMEFAGLPFDQGAWMAQMEAVAKRAQEVKAEIDSYAALRNVPRDKDGAVLFNYRSQKQCLELFECLKIKLKEEKEDGSIVERPVPDTSEDTLAMLKQYKVVGLLQEYRSLTTRLSTFGASFLDAVHPVTGRIHFELDQLGTATGRPASHSKSPINPLNIPSDEMYRKAFHAPPGYVMESHDYATCEPRIWAELSKDPKLIEIFKKRQDVHSIVASEIFGKKITKASDPALREVAKTINHGVAYGMGPKRIYMRVNTQGHKMSFKEAREYRAKFCERFRRGVDFLREAGRCAAATGCLTNLNGRRRFWVKPDPMDTSKYPQGMNDPAYRSRMYFIENEGGNNQIQSVNSDITKTAMVMLRDYKKKNRTRTEFFIQLYDEIGTITHIEDSPGFCEAKSRIMVEAAEKFLKNVPMEVEAHVGEYWCK